MGKTNRSTTKSVATSARKRISGHCGYCNDKWVAHLDDHHRFKHKDQEKRFTRCDETTPKPCKHKHCIDPAEKQHQFIYMVA